MADQSPDHEISIPKKRREVIVGAVLLSIPVFFTVLAVYDLLTRIAIIAPALWLLLVGAFSYSLIKDEGIRRSAIKVLGLFSRRHFVRAVHRENNCDEIQIGYNAFGRRFLYLAILAKDIERIYWSTGQASNMAGRELNDWSVAIWYDHHDPVIRQKKQTSFEPDQEIYVLGPTGRKEDIAAFGLALLSFLRDSGALLVQGKGDTIFLRQPPVV